jgi:hypothetical protein
MNASLLGQQQPMSGQHCSQIGVREHDQYDKYNNVPHAPWRLFVLLYLQAGWYVRQIFWKKAYLKGHIISGGRLCMTLMNISVKLSMMSGL